MFSSWRRHHNGYDSWGNSDSYWLGSRSHLGRMWPHNTVLSKAYPCLFFSQTRPEACLCSWRGREGRGEKSRERNSGESETVCVCVSFPNSQSGGRQVIVIPGQKQAWTALFFSLTVCTWHRSTYNRPHLYSCITSSSTVESEITITVKTIEFVQNS